MSWVNLCAAPRTNPTFTNWPDGVDFASVTGFQGSDWNSIVSEVTLSAFITETLTGQIAFLTTRIAIVSENLKFPIPPGTPIFNWRFLPEIS